LPNQVPTAVARARAKILAELSRLKRLAFAERYVGSTLSVLFESGNLDGFSAGTTANFLKVGIPSNVDLANQLKEVRITATSDRWALGTLTTEYQPLRAVPML
jgi:tRNA A37 methylthiotransferase MiaB